MLQCEATFPHPPLYQTMYSGLSNFHEFHELLYVQCLLDLHENNQSKLIQDFLLKLKLDLHSFQLSQDFLSHSMSGYHLTRDLDFLLRHINRFPRPTIEQLIQSILSLSNFKQQLLNSLELEFIIHNNLILSEMRKAGSSKQDHAQQQKEAQQRLKLQYQQDLQDIDYFGIVNFIKKSSFQEEYDEKIKKTPLWIVDEKSNPLANDSLISYNYSKGCFLSNLSSRIILQQTLILLAIYLYQIDHGNLPVTLNDLVPQYLTEIPLDLIDSQPMRYHREKALIYSIGFDEKDQQGEGRSGYFRIDAKSFKAPVDIILPISTYLKK
jgi:hypothetical protein